MQFIIISACLLGQSCRYDGQCREYPEITPLCSRKDIVLIPVCPEQAGGLATPRPAAERSKNGVFTREGRDVTTEYERGAREALRLARLYGCRWAVLKEKSPSCGSCCIYDGTFTRTLTEGDGVTVALFRKEGISVVGESRIPWLLEQL